MENTTKNDSSSFSGFKNGGYTENAIESALPEPFQSTLEFIEDFFRNHFNRKETVPASYIALCKTEMASQYQMFTGIIAKLNATDNTLPDSIATYLNRFLQIMPVNITYEKMAYHRELLNALTADKNIASVRELREVLYCFNFNEDEFVSYEYKKLQLLTENLSGSKEKILALRFEQKIINQLPVKMNIGYTSLMPSLKEQINGWIEEEIKYLEKGSFIEKPETGTKEYDDKIHTSLSVAKLAVLIRLLVIDKIIINRTAAPMLRTVARIFTSLQKEDISFGSLETKFHAPDKATINSVRDMLFKWINILGKL